MDKVIHNDHVNRVCGGIYKETVKILNEIGVDYDKELEQEYKNKMIFVYNNGKFTSIAKIVSEKKDDVYFESGRHFLACVQKKIELEKLIKLFLII